MNDILELLSSYPALSPAICPLIVNATQHHRYTCRKAHDTHQIRDPRPVSYCG